MEKQSRRTGSHRRRVWRLVLAVAATATSIVATNRKIATILSQTTAAQRSLFRTSPFSATHTNDIPVSRLLIVQYTAGSSTSSSSAYEKLLHITSQVNQGYARRRKYDYWLVKGLPFVEPFFNGSMTVETLVQNGLPLPSTSTMNATPFVVTKAPASRSTYTKVAILEHLLQNQDRYPYDRLLLLDADALYVVEPYLPVSSGRQNSHQFSLSIADFSFDFDGWLRDEPLFCLAAHSTHNTSLPTGSINIGVTLWNLWNPRLPYLVERWRQGCIQRIQTGRRDDDQAVLQNILKNDLDDTRRRQVVRPVANQILGYGKGSIVQHWIRHSDDWEYSDQTSRIQRVQRAADAICTKHSLVCNTSILETSL